MIAKAGMAALVASLATAGAARAAESGVEVQDAWAAAGGKAGGEAPLYMTLTNHGDKPDSLQRVRCPVAWSAEPRVTDHGEGAPTSRAVKSIPIKAGSVVKLEPDGPYIALLQLKDPLREGDKFSCSVAFSGSGTKEVAVNVSTKHDTTEVK